MFDPAQIPAALTEVDDNIAARIEEAGLNAAQPSQQLLYDGWLLRFSPGKARRARSVNAIAGGRLPLVEKIAYCRRWYVQSGLPCLFRITPFSQPRALDAALAQAGFAAIEETRVMTLALPLAAPPSPRTLRVLGIDEFAHCAGALRDSPPQQVAAHAARLAASPLAAHAQRLAAVDGETVLAVGQSVREGELVGLYDIVTAESARGRGLASALTVELLRRAADDGATIAYLQVSADNAAARRVYGRLGFIDRYAYWYRSEPSASQAQIGAGGERS
jgi:ribosomal protein S18 acetylase RimI-like enzyme